MRSAFSATVSSYQTAWRLRVPFVLSHLMFNLLLVAIFTPLMAATVHLALRFSGQPALADFDIAMFLLSPVGFVAGVLLAGMALVLLVLDVSFMMAVALRERAGQASGIRNGVELVLPRLPAVLGLAVQFCLRVVIICAPFLAVSGAAYTFWLGAYDINYYLSFQPPEFVRTVVVSGVSIAAMLALLLWRCLGWALALPLVLFEGRKATEALRESRKKMAGRRVSFLVQVLLWIAAGGVLSSIVLGIVAVILQTGLDFVPFGLQGVAAFLLLNSLLWAVLNLLLTSITTGALAVVVLTNAGWPKHQGQQASLPKPLLIALAGGVAFAFGVGGFGLVDVMAVKQDRPVDVIAHRGASGAAPENTMAAVLRAIEDGADWIEIDVQETVDGDVVVMHDSDFMKVAGNPLKIWDATLADLQDIDIGSWFDPAFSSETTPLLENVLLKSKDKAGVVIELKYYGHDEALEERVIEIVERTDMVDQVKLMSLKSGAVAKLRKLRPDWDVGLLASASLGNMWDFDVDFLAVNSATMSHRLVKSSQDVGKDVYVWTVNDALSMSGMLSYGVDGLITDEPELARQVLADRRELNGIERLILGLAGRIGLDLPDRTQDE